MNKSKKMSFRDRVVYVLTRLMAVAVVSAIAPACPNNPLSGLLG